MNGARPAHGRRATAVAAALLLGACAASPPRPAPDATAVAAPGSGTATSPPAPAAPHATTAWRPRAGAQPARLELDAVPFFPQREYECGPAALATVLGASGVAVQPDELLPEVYLPARRGSLQLELVAAARRRDRVPFVLEPSVAALRAELAAGRPVLVLQNFGSAARPQWHYAVVIGWEPGRVLLRSGTERRLALAEARFAGTWRRAERWAVVLLQPGELPASATPARFLEAASGLESTGRLDAAAAAYGAAAERWPDEPGAWLGLGNVAAALGRTDDAERRYARALATPVRDGDAAGTTLRAAAAHNRALLLERRGCVPAALRGLESAALAAAGTALEPALREALARLSAAQAGAGSGAARSVAAPHAGTVQGTAEHGPAAARAPGVGECPTE